VRQKEGTSLGLLVLEDEGAMFLGNVGKY